MQLYRLDSLSGPVCDLVGPVLLRKKQSARTAGIYAANARGEAVTLTTITQHGRLRPDLIIYPGGRCERVAHPKS